MAARLMRHTVLAAAASHSAERRCDPDPRRCRRKVNPHAADRRSCGVAVLPRRRVAAAPDHENWPIEGKRSRAMAGFANDFGKDMISNNRARKLNPADNRNQPPPAEPVV